LTNFREIPQISTLWLPTSAGHQKLYMFHVLSKSSSPYFRLMSHSESQFPFREAATPSSCYLFWYQVYFLNFLMFSYFKIVSPSSSPHFKLMRCWSSQLPYPSLITSAYYLYVFKSGMCWLLLEFYFAFISHTNDTTCYSYYCILSLWVLISITEIWRNS